MRPHADRRERPRCTSATVRGKLRRVVTRFLRKQGFPAGAVLMTDWGVTPTRWFRDGSEHKRSSLVRLHEDLPEVSWVLIGDDGEHDPDLYEEFARAHPGSVDAVALRQVAPDAADDGGTSEVAGVPVVRGTDGNALLPLLRAAMPERRGGPGGAGRNGSGGPGGQGVPPLGMSGARGRRVRRGRPVRAGRRRRGPPPGGSIHSGPRSPSPCFAKPFRCRAAARAASSAARFACFTPLRPRPRWDRRCRGDLLGQRGVGATPAPAVDDEEVVVGSAVMLPSLHRRWSG